MTGSVRQPTSTRWGRRAVRAGAAAIAVGMLLAGCGTSTDGNSGTSTPDGSTPSAPAADVVKDASATPKTGGTLKVAVEAETDGWDPSKSRWAASAYTVAGSFYDPLVIIDEDFKPKANLVESITPNADFTQWTFKLRPNVTFSDGDPFTADWLNQWFGIIKKSTLLGPAVAAVASSAVIDPLTVQVNMSEPWSAFPYLLNAQGGYIPSPKTVSSPDGGRNPSGTGAFTFKDWVPGKLLKVAKNPSYWRTGLPYLDGVEFSPVSDSQARIAALKTGDIDLMMVALADPAAQLATEAESGSIQLVHSQGDQDANLVLFNVRKPPFDDVRVRQALAYAVDRETLYAVSGTPLRQQGTTLYARDSRWYTDTGYYEYNPEKAKELIDAYVKEKGPLKFVFGTSPDPEVQKATTAILGFWKAVGAEIESQSFEQSTFVTNAVTGNYQVQIWRQFGAPDPDVNATWWLGANADTPGFQLNMAGNKDPQIDEALKKARSTLDQSTRKQQYDIVQNRFKDLVPYIWLSHVSWVMAANNKLRNIEYLTLPDGSKSIGLLNGTFPVIGIWIDQ